MEFTTSSLIALLIAFVHLDWAYIAWSNRANASNAMLKALLATLSIGFVGSLIQMTPTNEDLLVDALPQSEGALYAATALLISYSVLTLYYFQLSRVASRWLRIGGLIWLLSVGWSFIDTSMQLGAENWLSDTISDVHIAGLLHLVIWGGISMGVLVLAFYQFYRASLPEVANRAMLWAVVMPLVSMGALLGVSGSSGLREVGWVIQVVGLGLVTYSVVAVSGLDIRRTSRLLIGNSMLVVLTAAFIFLILFISDEVQTDIDRIGLFAGVALGAAVPFVPAYFVVQGMVSRLFGTAIENVNPEMRRFAEEITGVVELDHLAEVVMQTLRDVLGVRRGALILVQGSEDDVTLRVEPYEVSMGKVSTTHGFLMLDGIIYSQFLNERKPLLQFDLDFKPEYHNISDHEKGFFKHLQMAAFAPIVVQGQLVGILASGPKANDDRFRRPDLDLLSTIANQTGIGLQSARLVDDVLRRERDLAETNKRLEATKRQLEALDSVKTDFITIASHELRTPLAQIRGHTDIIQALNEEDMLDPEQLGSLTANLRKAADRLEGLIGDMLDVSQLDLSAMDLRFAETTIESAVRMAVEPLHESIRNRKQSLTARGLRGLPPLEADVQRLVQAIRNVVLNAVKYTPDGGRIDIIGTLIANPDTGADEIQLEIRDNGIGIDPKNKEAIFDKFFRASDPGLHSTGTTKFMGAGPGLGLTIARGVIEGHGGRIWVESEEFDPDNLPGSTFYIVLPLTPPQGTRRVLPISSSGRHVGSTDPADATDDELFVEPDPTLLNPSAHRAGLTKAAMAAAEKARRQESNEPDS